MRPHCFAACAIIVLHRRLARHVGREGLACAFRVLRRHRAGLLRRGEIAVDGQHRRAFLREADDGRPAVAHAGARPLPGADDDGDFVFQTH